MPLSKSMISSQYKEGATLGITLGTSLLARAAESDDLALLFGGIDTVNAELNSKLLKVFGRLTSPQDKGDFHLGLLSGLDPFLGSLLSAEPTRDQARRAQMDDVLKSRPPFSFKNPPTASDLIALAYLNRQRCSCGSDLRPIGFVNEAFSIQRRLSFFDRALVVTK